VKKIRLYCDRPSTGLLNLRNALREAGVDCKRIKRNRSTYRRKSDHVVINWGCSEAPYLNMLNPISGVRIVSNKLSTLKLLRDHIPVPTFFQRKEEAKEYLQNNSGRIFCRTKLTGHSGEGIVLSEKVEELVDAPLYTVGINNGGEFRVHIFRNLNSMALEIIDITKKRRRAELMEQEGAINSHVRNVQGGWVYCHNNVELPTVVKILAKTAIEILGLDFGAVDIIREKNTDNYYDT